MRVLIIRHADAVDAMDDDVRELSVRGRQEATALGRFLRHSSLPAPAEIWHSPLVRARQTSELLRESAFWSSSLRPTSGLLPYDDPEALAAELPASGKDIAVVGHNPYLSRLSSLLVTGDADSEAFLVKKATCICLEQGLHLGNSGAFSRWSVAWMLSPEVVPEQREGGGRS